MGSKPSKVLPFCLSFLFGTTCSFAQFTFFPSGGAKTNLYANDLVINGNYAYVSYEGQGLCIFDISDPDANPIFLSRTNNGGSPEGLAMSGDKIFLANYDDGIRVYDVSNPAKAVNTAHTDDGGLAWNLAVQSNFLFLANSSDGLRVYDISNPSNLVNVGHAYNGGAARSLAIAGTSLYLANSTDGLRIYDISTPSNPLSVTNASSGNALSVAVYGHHAFVQSLTDPGLNIFDVTDPHQLQLIAQINGRASTYPFHPFSFTGRFMYAARFDGLHLYDISNPANPFEVGQTNTSASVYGPSCLTIARDRIYVANQADGVRVYRLSGPTLTATPTGTNSIIVSWPSNLFSFRLQQRGANDAGIWTNLPDSPVSVSNRQQMILPQQAGPQLFRLRLIP